MEVSKVVSALIAQDDARPRSQQTAIGVSSLGGCRRQVWHSLNGDAKTNPTKRLAAIMGTAIHASLEAAFADSGALIEHRVEIDGLPPATIDYFDPATGEVVDWKTITLKGRDYFVSQQKLWQIQTYGYLLTRAGFDVKTVTLVGIPRDGSEDDIIVKSWPYDEAIALNALAWLDNIKGLTEAPAPERDASFCKQYCSFYGSACSGIPKDMSGEVITDPMATDNARRYVEISQQINALEKEKDGVKEALAGVVGITIDGIKVSWSEIAGRKTPDTDTIEKLLGEIPMKQSAPSLRLTVK